jgi:hypothetical protein
MVVFERPETKIVEKMVVRGGGRGGVGEMMREEAKNNTHTPLRQLRDWTISRGHLLSQLTFVLSISLVTNGDFKKQSGSLLACVIK